MKQATAGDIQRLEKKLDLINYKLDRIMQTQGIEFEMPKEEVDKEDEKKRKARERQQARIMMKENVKRRFEQMIEDRKLQASEGYKLQKQFNLLTVPSASRIREYQRTNNPKAFNGLKRNS